jgi:CheY-like chemotaxis protein
VKAPEAPQPVEAQAKELNPRKVLVAHENAMVVEEAMQQFTEQGYLVIPVPNGVDTLVQTMKELPFLVVLDAGLPKIDGYEIIKRLKEKDETSGIKAIVVSSKSDASRARKNPASMYGVNAYLDDDEVSVGLMDAMAAVIGGKVSEEAPTAAAPPEAPSAKPEPAAAPPEAPPAKPEPAPAPAAAPEPSGDKEVEKARRLARTVLSDIDLYDPEKVVDAVKNGQFEVVFAEELREGLRHYQSRIPKEVRARGNFFQEALDTFLEKKKKAIGIA